MPRFIKLCQACVNIASNDAGKYCGVPLSADAL